MLKHLCIPAFWLVMFASAAAQVELTQVISRENVAFDARSAVLTVGRDGRVYVSNQQSPGHVLRFEADGSGKFGGTVVYAMGNATANKDGVIATANAHFAHAVHLYDANFQPTANNAEFLVNDAVGWDAPIGVEAGELSGDFYGVDQHRNRVVRIDSQGRTVTTYPIQADEKERSRVFGMRVCEKTECFYWHGENNTVRCSDRNGKTQWTYKHADGLGGFDVTHEGTTFVIGATHDQGVRLSPDGKAMGTFTLQFGERKPVSGAHLKSLRVFRDAVFVKRFHPTELFQVFDLGSGERRKVVEIDHERLTVRYPRAVWTAGETTAFQIDFHAGGRPFKPQWKVWATSWGDSAWRELPWADDKVQIPRDMAGLYQLKVSPELRGTQAATPCEYLVRDMIEVRSPHAIGTVSLSTPGNRIHFAAREPWEVRVVVRTPAAMRPREVNVLLVDNEKTQARQVIRLDDEGRGQGAFESASLANLPPGRYRLTADLPDFTIASQSVVLGPGADQASDFRFTIHGDYGLTAPYGNLWDGGDVLASHRRRLRALHVNQLVDRFGIAMFRPQFDWSHHNAAELPDLMKRLAADPHGVDPEKARVLPSGLETMAAYGADGIRQWSILTYMDAGLPLGTGHDRRTPQQFQAEIKTVTSLLHPYPAFRGWSWTSNWWIYDPTKIVTEDRWRAYSAALKTAKETGKWEPILDEVGEVRWNLPIDARRVFSAALRETAPKLHQADSGPYRNVQVYPPLTYRDVDEVDVQFQAEQITVPNWHLHAVDFERRPGKPIWLHPEDWNDQGTGEQILTVLGQIAQRGADGVGSSGAIPRWGAQPHDHRSGYHGLPSIMRAAGELFHRHGDWIRKTQKHDRVAIVVSSRLMKIDDWKDFAGLYFTRLFEAYQSCLFAHRPASMVFAEDVDAAGLTKFGCILVVGQTVDMEPRLAELLRQAKSAGVPVFADASSRAECVAEWRPLGTAFDHIEKLHSINNDFAYWEHPRIFKENATTLRDKLAAIPPVADCDHPEITLSERLSPDGGVRYVFAVNNTTTPVEPGNLWKMTLGIATRLPIKTTLGLRDLKDCDVVDVFEGRTVPIDATGRVECDLRSLPMRVFAVVPRTSALRTKLTAVGGDEPIAASFGPHIKDIAVTGDLAVCNTFNWDHNLYAVDLENGQTRWRNRVGHYFAFAPQTVQNGVVVQSYDFNSAQGYHLHVLDAAGRTQRRFALPGLPQRLPHEFISGAMLLDRTNQFAAPATGDWVAAAGNLALTVWNRNGRELWSEDLSKTAPAAEMLLTPADDETLLTARGMKITALNPRDGTVKWRLEAARSGEIKRLASSADGGTIVASASTESGRLFVIRNGRIANSIPASGDELVVSRDGTRAAVVDGDKLKLYDTAGGLIWQFNGDDSLHHPRFSQDGGRIACSSELGTLYVLSLSGTLQLERDLRALAIPIWLPQGDLVCGTWMGVLVRLDHRYQEVWRSRLTPDPAVHDIRPIALQPAEGPTSRYDRWKNSLPEAADPAAGLLTPQKTVFSVVRSNQQQLELTEQPAKLFDGDRTPPAKPWLPWEAVYPVGSGNTNLTLVIDRFNTNLRVNAVTLVEDPHHPESWLRDVTFDYWNSEREQWVTAARLLSDEATHTHPLQTPVEAARFRISLPRGFVGNLRLAEIVLHGEELGPSHPDAIANRSTVVLFDENESDLAALKYPSNGFSFRYDDAYRGGKCLAMEADKTANAYYRPPFGHLIPNWSFRIVENPRQPGEYRWLSFAWKGTESSRGMTLRLGEHHAGGVVLHAGVAAKFDAVLATKMISDAPPQKWTFVTVDLWKEAGREMTVGSMSLSTSGGAATFDRILLGRTAEDVAEK